MVESIANIWLEFTFVIILIGIVAPLWGVVKARCDTFSRVGYLSLLQVTLFVLGFSDVISYSKNSPITAMAIIAASYFLVRNFTEKFSAWQVNTLFIFPILMLGAVILNCFSNDLSFSILGVAIT